MEKFLKNYTEQVEPLYSYESKFSYEKEFDSFRGMFPVSYTHLDCNYADHDAVYRAVYDCNFHQ